MKYEKIEQKDVRRKGMRKRKKMGPKIRREKLMVENKKNESGREERIF
jgi:hypothetical protein